MEKPAKFRLGKGLPGSIPVVHGHPLTQHGLPADWPFWERQARWHLERCSEVVVLMLEGWQESDGVQAELRHARVLGKPARHIDPEPPASTRDRGLHCLSCGSDNLRVL